MTTIHWPRLAKFFRLPFRASTFGAGSWLDGLNRKANRHPSVRAIGIPGNVRVAEA